VKIIQYVKERLLIFLKNVIQIFISKKQNIVSVQVLDDTYILITKRFRNTLDLYFYPAFKSDIRFEFE
jgi:hypothetical protein